METRRFAGGKMLSATRDGIGFVTFNQPEKRNAMSIEMWDGLSEILNDFAGDDQVRVVVLTGAGDKAFVSGADISQFGEKRNDAAAQAEYEKRAAAGRSVYENYPKPTIARVRGFCIGGGLALAMAADLRIASDDSQFAIPAARLGISYGYNYVRRLVSLVGPAEARMILYTAARLSAAEALRAGLVNRVVPAGELDDAVGAVARSIVDNAPLSVASMKLSVSEAVKDQSEADIAAVEAAIAACFDSADYGEGRSAFMEKRQPVFRGA